MVSPTHDSVRVVDDGTGLGVRVGGFCTLDHSPVPGTNGGRLLDDLTAVWRSALDARPRLGAGSPVSVLDRLLAGDDCAGIKIVYQDSPEEIKKEFRAGLHLRRPALAWTFLVGVAGFEPTTSSSRTKRATKLRYTPRRAEQS